MCQNPLIVYFPKFPLVQIENTVRWWANALAAAVKLQNCKKASSVRMILADLQSGKTTNGGLPRKNSRPRLWCLHCLTMAVSV